LSFVLLSFGTAIGLSAGAALLMATAGSVARIGAELTGKTALAAASTADPMDLVLDTIAEADSRRA
jgi:hypothetical protein